MTIRRLLSSLLLISCLGGATAVTWLQLTYAQNNPELFYTFFGQKIKLTEQPDAIAVSFKKIRTRGKSLYLQLQEDLSGGGSTPGRRGRRETSSPSPNSAIEVKPLGDQYAIVQLASQDQRSQIAQQIRQQEYVEATLPILSRQASSKESSSAILLPNEILVSFAPNLSDDEIETVLNQLIYVA